MLDLRWTDYNDETGRLTVTGKVIRVSGEGISRVDETKSAAGRRTIPLPQFAIATLRQHRTLPYLGEQTLIFPSTAAPCARITSSNYGAPRVRSSAYRRPPRTASARRSQTLIDDEGLSARIGPDHLGHSHVSMTQDRYMSRGRIHAGGRPPGSL